VKRYVQRFTRVYLTVTGPISADFTLSGLAVAHPQPPIPVVTHRSGLITYQISNTGNAIIAPTAQVTITGLFGSTTTKAFPATSQILPGGGATYSIPWLQLPAFGRVHVRLTVQTAYGISRVADYSYTAIPVLFLAAVVAVVLAVALAVGFVIGRRRRRVGRSAQPRKVPAVPAS
jgi:hypothetical protein